MGAHTGDLRPALGLPAKPHPLLAPAVPARLLLLRAEGRGSPRLTLAPCPKPSRPPPVHAGEQVPLLCPSLRPSWLPTPLFLIPCRYPHYLFLFLSSSQHMKGLFLYPRVFFFLFFF